MQRVKVRVNICVSRRSLNRIKQEFPIYTPAGSKLQPLFGLPLFKRHILMVFKQNLPLKPSVAVIMAVCRHKETMQQVSKPNYSRISVNLSIKIKDSGCIHADARTGREGLPGSTSTSRPSHTVYPKGSNREGGSSFVAIVCDHFLTFKEDPGTFGTNCGLSSFIGAVT